VRVKQQILKKEINELKSKIKTQEKEVSFATDAKLLVQGVSEQTQKDLEYQLSSLVTMALGSVLEDPYELQINYKIKYNRTEARLTFIQKGHARDPMTGTGGGVKDIASLGLRCSAWAMQTKKTRPILILDEPCRFINDPTRELYKKTADLIKLLSDKLNLQIIMISRIPEFQDISDQLIEISKKDGESHVTYKRRGDEQN